mmetsp:Transcript_7866/g.22365  ORF Transcript_7866/g.22365 Transcript_7866/m.22365 type:complete len:280 (+) Transcript_7866:116-955(+)
MTHDTRHTSSVDHKHGRIRIRMGWCWYARRRGSGSMQEGGKVPAWKRGEKGVCVVAVEDSSQTIDCRSLHAWATRRHPMRRHHARRRRHSGRGHARHAAAHHARRRWHAHAWRATGWRHAAAHGVGLGGNGARWRGHKRGRRTTHTPHGAGEADRRHAQRGGGKATPCGLANAWTRWHLLPCIVRRRGALDRERDDHFSAQQHEAQRTLFFTLLGSASTLLRFDLPELLAVREHNVHVLVKGQERPHQCSAVLDRDPHPVVHKLEHLGALCHRHGAGRC